MRKQVAALRKGTLELMVLTNLEPAALRREARSAEQKLTLVMLSLLEEGINEVERMEERLLALGATLPEGSGTEWMEACLTPIVENLRETYRRIRGMRRRTDGRSSTH